MLNIFGDKKSSGEEVIDAVLSEILEAGGFSLSFQFNKSETKNHFHVDVFGEDEGLLKAKDGKLLVSLQSYILRVLYRAFPDEEIRLFLDSNGFWDEKETELLASTDQLIQKALDSGRPVSFKKPLSARQRRLVHERASGNTGVRSQSIGEGAYKVMKLVPDTYRSER